MLLPHIKKALLSRPASSQLLLFTVVPEAAVAALAGGTLG